MEQHTASNPTGGRLLLKQIQYEQTTVQQTAQKLHILMKLTSNNVCPSGRNTSAEMKCWK